MSIGRRVFVVQLLNTAGLVLLVNADIEFLRGLGGTKYDDFTAEW